MRHRIICAVALIALLLTSCAKQPAGVAYAAVSEGRFNYVKSSMTEVLWSTLLLNYDGKMYTGAILEQDGADVDKVCGEKLGTVYGYAGAFWSDDKEKLTAVEAEAEVYSVKGYDKDFRVCVYVQKSDALFLFENLNGMTVRKGGDIFKKKLSLDKYEKSETVKNGELVEEKLDIDSFLKKICEAEFISPSEQGTPQAGTDCLYEVVFYDEAGLENTLKVYDGGYVVYEAWGGDSTYRFIVNIE